MERRKQSPGLLSIDRTYQTPFITQEAHFVLHRQCFLFANGFRGEDAIFLPF